MGVNDLIRHRGNGGRTRPLLMNHEEIECAINLHIYAFLV